MDVTQFEAVLGVLAGVYQPNRLRLLGGEPLLHPKFMEIVEVAKAANIADILQLTTNGMLLDRLPSAAWDLLDEIELSLYGISELSDERIAEIRRLGKAHGTVVNVSSYPNFRMTFTTQRAQDPQLVEEVWRGCKMANVWGCHALRGARLYRCPQSIYAPSLIGGSLEEEGFEITAIPDLQARLLEFLNAPGPLRACANCVGSCGKQFAQVGLPRRGWKEDLDVPYIEMIDLELLERSQKEIQVIDDCRTLLSERQRHGVLGKIRKLLAS